jgi:hypothetical protein
VTGWIDRCPESAIPNIGVHPRLAFHPRLPGSISVHIPYALCLVYPNLSCFELCLDVYTCGLVGVFPDHCKQITWKSTTSISTNPTLLDYDHERPIDIAHHAANTLCTLDTPSAVARLDSERPLSRSRHDASTTIHEPPQPRDNVAPLRSGLRTTHGRSDDAAYFPITAHPNGPVHRPSPAVCDE